MTAPPAIETHSLTKRFGSLVALDDVSIRVEPGEVYGFLGPNGAGKTTTIRLVLGFARPTAGRVQVFGHDAWLEPAAAHRHLSFVPGELNAWPTLRGGEVLDLLGTVHGGFEPAERDALCERFDFDVSRRGREYSKGNRQKIGLIAALMVRPSLLVLDEPTSGLDPLMEREFQACVREARDRGQSVFLSSHQLAEVEAVCDRVAILRRGRLVEVGRLDEMRKLNARHVTVDFAGASVPDLAGVGGVSAVEVDGNRVRLTLRGGPDALLHELARHPVAALDVRQPSLEELFLGYYGADAEVGGGEVGGGER